MRRRINSHTENHLTRSLVLSVAGQERKDNDKTRREVKEVRKKQEILLESTRWGKKKGEKKRTPTTLNNNNKSSTAKKKRTVTMCTLSHIGIILKLPDINQLGCQLQYILFYWHYFFSCCNFIISLQVNFITVITFT